MQRLLIAGLAILAAPLAAHAQSDPGCVARAQVARDVCQREAAAGGYSDRNCQSNYINDTSRCRRTVIRPRTTPQQRNKPVSPVKPVYPRVNPQ
jgi:hypothetical protein